MKTVAGDFVLHPHGRWDTTDSVNRVLRINTQKYSAVEYIWIGESHLRAEVRMIAEQEITKGELTCCEKKKM